MCLYITVSNYSTVVGIYIYVCVHTHTHTHIYIYTHTHIYIHTHIQGVSRLVDITAGGDFLGLCDQKSSYKRVSDFRWLQSYGHF
jgi:hypothetical protein